MYLARCGLLELALVVVVGVHLRIDLVRRTTKHAAKKMFLVNSNQRVPREPRELGHRSGSALYIYTASVREVQPFFQAQQKNATNRKSENSKRHDELGSGGISMIRSRTEKRREKDDTLVNPRRGMNRGTSRPPAS